MSKVLYDLNELILPHGEDGISYEFCKGDLVIKIQYDECSKHIQLKFLGCSYQYFAPVPGYYPTQIMSNSSGYKTQSGYVYELSDTDLLKESESVSESAGYKPNRRHFFLYLEWANVTFNIIAQNCDYSYAAA